VSLEKHIAHWTYDPQARAYYFAPANRAASPYRTQRHVTAILDIAIDGTLAGVELVMGDLPPPPTGATVRERADDLANYIIDKAKR
jgi:hypothetical protein